MFHVVMFLFFLLSEEKSNKEENSAKNPAKKNLKIMKEKSNIDAILMLLCFFQHYTITNNFQLNNHLPK